MKVQTVVVMLFSISLVFSYEDDTPLTMRPTSRLDFPFLVYVQVLDDKIKSAKSGCTGTILTERWVLTIAHCYGDNPATVSPGSVMFIVCNGSSCQIRYGKEIRVHPKKASDSQDPFPDVALAKTDRDFEFGALARNIPIYWDAFPAFLECYEAGWSFSKWENGTRSNVPSLQVFSVVVMPYEYCTTYQLMEYEEQFCFKAPYGKHVGYKGNPIICNNELLGIRYIRTYYRDDGYRVDVAVRISELGPWLTRTLTVEPRNNLNRGRSHEDNKYKVLFSIIAMLLGKMLT